MATDDDDEDDGRTNADASFIKACEMRNDLIVQYEVLNQRLLPLTTHNIIMNMLQSGLHSFIVWYLH